jgi:hypothetical protein
VVTSAARPRFRRRGESANDGRTRGPREPVGGEGAERHEERVRRLREREGRVRDGSSRSTRAPGKGKKSDARGARGKKRKGSPRTVNPSPGGERPPKRRVESSVREDSRAVRVSARDWRRVEERAATQRKERPGGRGAAREATPARVRRARPRATRGGERGPWSRRSSVRGAGRKPAQPGEGGEDLGRERKVRRLGEERESEGRGERREEGRGEEGRGGRRGEIREGEGKRRPALVTEQQHVRHCSEGARGGAAGLEAGARRSFFFFFISVCFLFVQQWGGRTTRRRFRVRQGLAHGREVKRGAVAFY